MIVQILLASPTDKIKKNNYWLPLIVVSSDKTVSGGTLWVIQSFFFGYAFELWAAPYFFDQVANYDVAFAY